MTAKFHLRKQTSYLSVYFVLLLVNLFGLFLQSGVITIIGLASWFGLIFGTFIYQNNRHHAKP
jgi:hypothetical protein